MERTLSIGFKDIAGKKYNFSIRDIKEDVLEADVVAIMNNIIEKKVIKTTYGDLVEKASAQVVTKEVDKFTV